MLPEYDIIIVGAGHAGSEAAYASATMGCTVLLITMDISKIAQMSCNPAIGGIAKGQIVREIDALGGNTAIITDQSSIQFRMLNLSKGPAMWSPRSQCDRFIFSDLWRKSLENLSNLYLWQDSVTELILRNSKVCGVKTQMGLAFHSKKVILTNGTFLSGLIHVGTTNFPGGRVGESNSIGITEQLKSHGIESGRMKTGTPVRIDGRTVNYDKLIEQSGDTNLKSFSYLSKSTTLPQLSCFIAHTSPQVHSILKKGFNSSPLIQGVIQGVGPRYCPSIEDKLRTFSDKQSHQLFLEPEGMSTYEMYLNGFSSSLPADIQYEALRAIEGFENVHIIRPGYAIEYDYFPPTQLNHTLETKSISSLYFAGQINGTTGYEEAAAQGLMAAINAVQAIKCEEPIVLKRDEAYIGVLIDDLVTKGVDEPYRMFTSRAEHRVLLRQDNADERLTPLGLNLGLATMERKNRLDEKMKAINYLEKRIKSQSVKPDQINPFLESIKSSQINQSRKVIDIALRPEVSLCDLLQVLPALNQEGIIPHNIYNEVVECTQIRVKYGGYIEREYELAQKLLRLDHVSIHSDFNYNQLKSLSIEARQKLSRIKPTSIGQARRIPGVTPSDINVLLVYLGR